MLFLRADEVNRVTHPLAYCDAAMSPSGRGAEGIGSQFAYPPRLSMIADIPALTLSASQELP